MKTFAIGAFVAVLAGATAMAEPAPPNTLTSAEKAAGWKLLFDGKTTAGWRGFKGEPNTGWHVKDGALGPDPKVPQDLLTRETFGSFELAFEWQVTPKGNSGVMYRITEDAEKTYHTGPEYQVLDNSRGEPPKHRAGAVYDLYEPSQDATRPVGQFNEGRIVSRGDKVEHWLNGVKVVEYDMGSADFKARVAASKFRQWPQFAASPRGHIVLQNHGDVVAFRNIKIRPLD